MAQSDESPRENISRNISKHVYREILAAATAASECGTAKLEHMMMLMNGVIRPKSIPLRNSSKLIKNAEAIGNQDILTWRKSVGPKH
jgi:hypothetical protein